MNPNLIFVHYPSGGYGYYLTRLINRYISNIVKTPDPFTFDERGTSHSLPLVYGDIHYNRYRDFNTKLANILYQEDIALGKSVLVPCCPGINDNKIFITLDTYEVNKFVHLWYDDRTWPLVFHNAITKAMNGNVHADVEFDENQYGSSKDWARRENFSIMLVNHSLRSEWKPTVHERVCNINIFDLLTDPGRCLEHVATFLGFNCMIDRSDLERNHQTFLDHNIPTSTHLKILDLVENLKIGQPIGWITDLFWQACMNFYIEQKHGIIIPSNTYSNWFKNSEEIVTMLQSHGIKL